MSKELVQRAHWGDLEGMNWAGLARLSTEEADGELGEEGEAGRRFVTGRDIKSTAEQEKDGREFVETRGGRYVHTYLEPDTSAWKKRKVRQPDGSVAYRVVRPVFEGALEDLKTGRAPNGERVDGLIVYDIDRLTRDPRHLEDAIEVVQNYHRPIIDITGTLDLLTDNGRAMARVLVTMANKQSADTARRVKRKHRALREQGIPVGGTRPFGWQADKRTLNPAEAKRLRDAAERLIEGAPWGAVVAEWNHAGVTTTGGKTWTRTVLQDVMTNPRICGYRSYQVDDGTERARMAIARDRQGEAVTGQWEPVLTVAQWEALCAIRQQTRTRGSGDNARRYLLTGTLRCGQDDCGALLRAVKSPPSRGKPEGHFRYSCRSKGTGYGCGGVSIDGPEADELVGKMVIAKYEEEAAERDAVTEPAEWQGAADLARVREDLADLKAARKQRQISAERYYADLAEYEAEERQLINDRNAWQRKALAAEGAPVDMAAEWHRDDITLSERRAYVERTFTALVVMPVGRGRQVPVRDRLVPVYAED